MKLFTIVEFIISMMNEVHSVNTMCWSVSSPFFAYFVDSKLKLILFSFAAIKTISHSSIYDKQWNLFTVLILSLLPFCILSFYIFDPDSVLRCIWNRPNRLFWKFLMLFAVRYELWGCSTFICFLFSYSILKWSLDQGEYWTEMLSYHLIWKFKYCIAAFTSLEITLKLLTICGQINLTLKGRSNSNSTIFSLAFGIQFSMFNV